MAEVQVKAEISGSVWKVLKAAGEAVEEDEPVLILESMKMEIPVMAPEAGTVLRLLVTEGDAVAEGQPVAVIEA